MTAMWAAIPVQAGLAAKEKAWNDCLKLCIPLGAAPPSGLAWVTGCTLAYDADLLSQFWAYAPELVEPGPAFAYNSGTIVTLGAGRWDGTDFLSGQGTVTGVAFSVVPYDDLLAASTFDSAPWMLLGAGTFSSSTNLWSLNWNTGSFTNPDGYALRAEFFDTALPESPTPAVGAALVTPEPSTMGLFLTGMLTLIACAWRLRTPTDGEYSALLGTDVRSAPSRHQYNT
jgi:hypothetical protein